MNRSLLLQAPTLNTDRPTNPRVVGTALVTCCARLCYPRPAGFDQ